MAQDAGPRAAEVATRPPDSLKVAAVQFRSSRDLDENVARITGPHPPPRPSEGVRVAVFPECALTGYFEDVVKAATAERLAEAERRVADACREAGIYAVVGTPHRDGDKLYNSATVIDPSGRVIERYHKVQLAEPWPTPGDHLSVFRVDGVPCSIIICHDERYPELVRLPVLAGARVVFYVSHESGVRQESKLGPYRAQIQARAVENTVYVVHANAPANDDLSGSHGQSRVIAPDGNIVQEASMFGEEVVDGGPRPGPGDGGQRPEQPGPRAAVGLVEGGPQAGPGHRGGLSGCDRGTATRPQLTRRFGDDLVEVDLIAREAVLPLAADGLDRPPLAQHLDPGIARARQREASPSSRPPAWRPRTGTSAPSCRLTTKSTGTPPSDEATDAPPATSGLFRTGASSRICRLMSATPRAISSSARSPASMNFGLNWWAK